MTAAMDRQAIAAGVGSSFIFVLLNVSMNLYMKWLFAKDGGDFAFPWTMLAVQQLQAYMVLQPLIAWRYPTIRNCGWDVGGDESPPSSSPTELQDDISGEHQRESGVGLTATIQVLAVTGLFCLNVGLNSLSLVKMSITLNQTVRAFLPVGVLLLATVLERRTYPRHSYYTTCVLIVGIGLTCWGSPHFEFNGFFLAFTSTIIAAAGSSLNGRLLNAGPFSKAGPGVIARLLMYQSVPAFIVFALVAYVSEGDRVRHAFSAPSAAAHRVLLISISSVLALMSNLGRCFLVAATSALMETLAGNAKVAALCIIDHQLFHTELHHYNYVGVAITFTGFSMHVLLQYASRPSELERDGPQKDMANKLALAERNEEQELEESNSKEPEAGTNGNSHEESNGDSNGDLHGRRHAPLNQPTIRLQPRPPLSLPLQISGGETGLISEQVAVRIGKPARKARRRRHLSSINEEDFDENRNEDTFHHQDHDHEQLETEDNRRMRASTWQAGSDPTKSWLGRVSDRAGVKLAPILEPPPWLSQEDAEDADMLPTSYSADAGFSREGPDRLSAHSPLVANGGAFLSEGSSRHRLRIWSDMTHCRADTPQLRPL